jgi:hypothetical protein
MGPRVRVEGVVLSSVWYRPAQFRNKTVLTKKVLKVITGVYQHLVRKVLFLWVEIIKFGILVVKKEGVSTF